MSENNHFSIKPSRFAGFTDQLVQFSAAYKLGKALGYHYVHQPFTSERSSLLPILLGKYHARLGSLSKYVYKLMRLFINLNTPNQNIYEYLMFNDYYSSITPPLNINNHNTIQLELCDEILEDILFENKDDFLGFMGSYIDKNVINKPLLELSFSNLGKSSHIIKTINALISSDISDDLRSAFLDIYPCKANNRFSMLNTMIHIRLGDTALIETPWDTFIPLWPDTDHVFKEHDCVASIPGNRALLPQEYISFIKGFYSYFTVGTYATAIFSDGYHRAIYRLETNFNKTGMRVQKRRELVNYLINQDDAISELFGSVDNSTVKVGENVEYLFDLINSVLCADLIITSGQQSMIPKFLSVYSNTETMPIVIVLYRNLKPSYQYVGLSDDTEKLIFVDIDNVDYDNMAAKVRTLIPEMTKATPG